MKSGALQLLEGTNSSWAVAQSCFLPAAESSESWARSALVSLWSKRPVLDAGVWMRLVFFLCFLLGSFELSCFFDMLKLIVSSKQWKQWKENTTRHARARSRAMASQIWLWSVLASTQVWSQSKGQKDQWNRDLGAGTHIVKSSYMRNSSWHGVLMMDIVDKPLTLARWPSSIQKRFIGPTHMTGWLALSSQQLGIRCTKRIGTIQEAFPTIPKPGVPTNHFVLTGWSLWSGVLKTLSKLVKVRGVANLTYHLIIILSYLYIFSVVTL